MVGLSYDIKRLKTQLSKMAQSGGCNPFSIDSFLFDPLGVIAKKKGSFRVTVTNNEIKDVTKVIRSLENRNILLKVTTRKINSQKGGGFLNFLKSLMTADLQLTKNV